MVTQKMVNDLPLYGRNFTELLELTPGVSPSSVALNSGGWGGQPRGSFTYPSVNGQSNRSNLFLMDGVNNQGSFESKAARLYASGRKVDFVQDDLSVRTSSEQATGHLLFDPL